MQDQLNFKTPLNDVPNNQVDFHLFVRERRTGMNSVHLMRYDVHLWFMKFRASNEMTFHDFVVLVLSNSFGFLWPRSYHANSQLSI